MSAASFRWAITAGLALALMTAGCQTTTGEADRDLPAGACVVLTGDPLNGNTSGLDAVPCVEQHTHVVTGSAAMGQCAAGQDWYPTIVEAGRVYCLTSVMPSPTPGPGGVTVP